MESSEATAAATVYAEAAMTEVMNSAPTSKSRDLTAQIDDVMAFLRFSVKKDSAFEGAILFKFKGDPTSDNSTYLVSVSDKREVSTKKNGTAKDAKVTCEVSMSMDDFLYVYSGKASNSDLVQMFYSGRVSISGYAFRKVSHFVQSFDFSTDMWTKFYSWQDREQHHHHQSNRSSGGGGSTLHNNGIGRSPSRDFWFYYCRAILERYNISKLQRITWEASLASMFGDQFILDNLRRSVRPPRRSSSSSFTLPPTHQAKGGLIAGLVGVHVPPQLLRVGVESELAHFFHPKMKRRNTIAMGTLATSKATEAANIFNFFDDEYLDAVKISAKQRYARGQQKNRVDLADAGMEQLDKLLKAWGKDGHSNKQCKTKPRYIPAPELILREFRTQATELVHQIQEKALGRKRVDRIPLPDTAWLFGVDSGMLVVNSGNHHSAQNSTDSSTTATGSRIHTSSSGQVSSTIPASVQELVVVDRSQTAQRRGSLKRDFKVPKQKILAKFESFSRDLNATRTPLSLDDQMIFSDYA